MFLQTENKKPVECRINGLCLVTAIPCQYFNHINHLVGMIRQKHDVACAEYRLECPYNIQVTAVGMSSIRGKFK